MRTALLVLVFVVSCGCMGPPAPPPATGASFAEGFDAAEHLPAGWQAHAGRWVLVDEPVAPSQPHVVEQRATVNDTRSDYVALDHGTFDDFNASARVRLMPGGGSAHGGLLVRYADEGDYYVARVSHTDGSLRFVEYRGGDEVPHAESLARPIPLGEWILLSVTAKGDALTMRVNGEEPFTLRDDTFRVGHVGLWTQDDSIVQFDDVRVERAQGPYGAG